MATAPTAMKTARRDRAMTIPASNAVCCSSWGTLNLAMMIKNTKRLSTLRLYSVSQPA